MRPLFKQIEFFFWHTDCIFQLSVLSLIYARAKRVPPRDFTFWANPYGSNYSFTFLYNKKQKTPDEGQEYPKNTPNNTRNSEQNSTGVRNLVQSSCPFKTFIFFTASFPVATASPGQPQHFENFRSFETGNYNVSWIFNSSMDSLHFTLEVRATGWVGFGVATQAPNNMTYYDVAVGGVVNGSGYLKVN